ncbi:hypothetical protein FBY34_8029 [Streptomyces sp. SLBN-115]|nr:hypothetical protein FBY34_8029 [Streptomyces sp. SLBN-115]
MDEAKGRGLHRLSQILSMLIRTVRPWFPGWRRQRRYSVTSGWRVRRRWARGARRAGAGCGWRRGVFGSWHGRFVGIHCRAAVFLAELFRLPETSQDVRVGTTGSGEFRPRPPTCHGPCPASARLEAMTLGHRAGHGWSQTFLNTRFGERIEAADGGSAHTTRTGPPPDKARGRAGPLASRLRAELGRRPPGHRRARLRLLGHRSPGRHRDLHPARRQGRADITSRTGQVHCAVRPHRGPHAYVQAERHVVRPAQVSCSPPSASARARRSSIAKPSRSAWTWTSVHRDSVVSEVHGSVRSGSSSSTVSV